MIATKHTHGVDVLGTSLSKTALDTAKNTNNLPRIPQSVINAENARFTNTPLPRISQADIDAENASFALIEAQKERDRTKAAAATAATTPVTQPTENKAQTVTPQTPFMERQIVGPVTGAQLVYGGIGLTALGAIGWLVFGNKRRQSPLAAINTSVGAK